MPNKRQPVDSPRKTKTNKQGLQFGLPQGYASLAYNKPVGKIIQPHNIKHNCYADDTQVYTTLKSYGKWDNISSSIETCIEDIGI